MTSEVMIRKVAEKSGMTIKDVRAIVSTFENTLKEFVANGEKVKFCDVTFEVQDVPATERYIPTKGKREVCPATKRIKVHPAADLKRVAKGQDD